MASRPVLTTWVCLSSKYRLPYESIEKPGEFLQTATNALNFLRTSSQTIQNVTVHVWISFISVIRGQSRVLVPDYGYVKKLAETIIDINKHSPLPIFVNILTDARLLGSQSSIVSIAEEFATMMKNKGILHSTNEKFGNSSMHVEQTPSIGSKVRARRSPGL